jgi:ADP-ribose pyrophosphatase YjhB (NUDIX family)
MTQKQQPVIFAASAAVWHEGKVLLVKRGRSPGKDFWSLPGGKVEQGETLQEAALREVLEETGLSPKIHGLIGVFKVAAGAVQYEISCFAAQSSRQELMPGDDAADAQWFSPDDLQSLNLAPNTLDAIVQSQGFIKP